MNELIRLPGEDPGVGEEELIGVIARVGILIEQGGESRGGARVARRPEPFEERAGLAIPGLEPSRGAAHGIRKGSGFLDGAQSDEMGLFGRKGKLRPRLLECVGDFILQVAADEGVTLDGENEAIETGRGPIAFVGGEG